MLPDVIENYIDEDNPARLFDSSVESFDLKWMGFRSAVLKKGSGRATYDPSDLPKIEDYYRSVNNTTLYRFETQVRNSFCLKLGRISLGNLACSFKISEAVNSLSSIWKG
ncbi:MAG: hypothetical protein QW292_10130 [Candidatus Parvarchaeota archaeon]